MLLRSQADWDKKISCGPAPGNTPDRSFAAVTTHVRHEGPKEANTQGAVCASPTKETQSIKGRSGIGILIGHRPIKLQVTGRFDPSFPLLFS